MSLYQDRSGFRHFALALGAMIILATAVRAQNAAPPATSQPDGEPTLQQRLERLCDQLEKQRETLHIPGMALAIVKDDHVILARGFGQRDVEHNLPANEDTLFAIGSSSKAFTATVIGMLIDEGKMSWDDPVRKFLPDFHLKDPTADEQITIRDLLCHRSGLARTDILWAAGTASREEILHVIANAELFTPFRQKFNYNNVMFLAAGEAAARAAGTDWDSLLAQRILKPLEMNATTTDLALAKKNPLLSRGYQWEDDSSSYELLPMRDLHNIAPAGAINSNVKDMAKWVRFQLAKGEINGQRLISADRVEETWTKQIGMAPDIDYGMGWMLHKWNTHRLVEHGGNIDGFAAEVALLPDDGVGFVLLSNVTASPLQSMAIGIVFDALLGQWNQAEPVLDLAEVQPYLGNYHLDKLNADVTVLVQDGHLAVDVPGQRIYELKPPDAQGRWVFAMTDQIAISFVKNQKNEVTTLTFHQSGLDLEAPRLGVAMTPEVTLEEVRKYLGTYHFVPLNNDMTVLVHNGRLAVDVPQQMIYELRAPDEEGRWVFRATDTIVVKFNADDAGEISSMTMMQNGQVFELPRTNAAADEALPSIDQLVALQMKGYGADHLAAIGNLRMTGTVNFINQGLSGTITTTTAGMDRFIQETNLGKFGFIKQVLDRNGSWGESSFHEFEQLHGEFLEQSRRLHPLLMTADLRTFFDKIEIVRFESLDDVKVLVVNLAAKSVTATLYVNAETGLVAKEEIGITIKNVGTIKTTITYDEYRDVNGVKIPCRFSVANDINGRMNAQIDQIETNVTVPDDAFIHKPAPPPSTEHPE